MARWCKKLLVTGIGEVRAFQWKIRQEVIVGWFKCTHTTFRSEQHYKYRVILGHNECWMSAHICRSLPGMDQACNKFLVSCKREKNTIHAKTFFFFFLVECWCMFNRKTDKIYFYKDSNCTATCCLVRVLGNYIMCYYVLLCFCCISAFWMWDSLFCWAALG